MADFALFHFLGHKKSIPLIDDLYVSLIIIDNLLVPHPCIEMHSLPWDTPIAAAPFRLLAIAASIGATIQQRKNENPIKLML